MTKEKLMDSARFKVALVTIIFEGLIAAFIPLAQAAGIELSGESLEAAKEVAQTVAQAVAGIIMAFVLGRSYRNV